MSELLELRESLGNVIKGTCNTVGCNNCDLKWDGGGSATDLDARIMAIELEPTND